MNRKNAKPAQHTGGKRAPLPQSAAPAVKSRIRLTISLLVSNRIDTIRKCLNSIKPLLDAVPSELIVIDTVGPENSDGSLAVAREFTDKIVRFVWCDDFSAARNAGLKLAKGEWFLFLDDDEWFEDVSPIVDFLRAEDQGYGVCQYRVRNYADRGGLKYADTIADRLVRLNGQVHFEDRIHEYLVGYIPRVKTLDAFAHHYGYVYDNREAFARHILRNEQSLEKLLADQPGNPRVVAHLVQELLISRDYEKAELYCRDALEAASSQKGGRYVSMLSNHYISALISQKKWDGVLEQTERLLNRPDISELAKVGICLKRNECAHVLFDCEKTLSNIDAYFRWLDILDKNPDKLAAQQVLLLGMSALDPSRSSVLQKGLNLAADRGDEARCRDYIRRIAAHPGEGCMILEQCMPLMILFAINTDTFGEVYSLIEPLLEKESVMSSFLSCVQACLEPVTLHEHQVRLAEFLVGLPLDEPYILLLKMRAAEKAGDRDRLAALFDHSLDLENLVFVQELLQIACRNGLDLAKCAGKINIDQWSGAMRALVDTSPLDQSRGILQALRAHFAADSLEILSLEIAIERRALKEDRPQGGAAEQARFLGYIDRLYAYHTALGNPENFSEARCHYLASGARSVFYLKRAADFGSAGDLASQARMLRKALQLRSDLVGFIEMMMKDLEARIEREKAAAAAQANAELQALAERLKGTVLAFIQKGDLRNAKIVLDQMSGLLPGDPDIFQLYMLLKQ
jgi:hypothetical protein